MMMQAPIKKVKRLNRENYYSNEMDWKYMSATMFKNFIKCESAALDQLKHPPEQVDSKALLIGNYVHSYMESNKAYQEFIDDHHAFFFTQKGSKRADATLGDKMIKKLEQDALFQYFYNSDNCEKEVILTGNLFDAQWKARIDSLNVEKGYFCDIKTTRELHKRYWSVQKRTWVSFIEEYNYALQMGVYKRLLQHKYHKPFNCYIFAVDKTQDTELEAIQMPNEDMEEQMEFIETHIERVKQVIAGDIEPVRCERCAYCKSTRKLNRFITPAELILE
ncbi:PD-(D/E)XK nuclease-like domain-containing protein [Liquorilactobacillus mali]|uniref:PD-(D/E)XK nuclease-like domain-containing protein n=1 Tax=Liquorilactobacillus mali TaxID=1618 RepID=UPI00265079D5|nr:PD-(D/E)XK nuclease-like domain-containing protein [Liquorilactobacillus mali]MDN7144415.1 PD-(D/E)XK nuclease-like domain-containing protein [Liquorilactobacillus mali]